MATVITSIDPQVQTSRAVFADMVQGYGPRDFAVRFWDGTTWGPSPGQLASFTLVLNHPGSMRRIFWPPRALSMGKAFVYDDFNVEGDMLAFTALCRYLANLRSTLSLTRKLKLAWGLWRLPRYEKPRTGRQAANLSGEAHSKERDNQAVNYHYDMLDDFADLVLDPQHMQYTSAVFANANESLLQAQERKLDLICRKLRLKAGERLLDVGCGYGGLAMFAARNYGVHALGVTLNKGQVASAQQRIRELGLESRCRIEVCDYRDISEKEPFDKITNIEALEHFGAKQFPVFFQKCMRLLRPKGLLLVQQITRSGPARLQHAREFNQQYVFPDGELMPISFTQHEAEVGGFEVRDVEGFREHYALTIQHWLNNLEASRDEILRRTDEATYRIFRLYFAFAWMGMHVNVYNLHQMLVVKPDGFFSGLPLTARNEWNDR